MRRTILVAALLFGTVALAGKPKKPVDPEPAPTPPPTPAVEAPAPELPEPPPIVKYRHEMMEGVGAHFGQLMLLVKGEVDRPKDAGQHAHALFAASRSFCELFPEGTGPDAVAKTRATALIWTQAADFEAKCADFRAATEALAEAAKGEDFAAVQEKARAVGQSCGGCHEDYRAKRD